MPPASDSSLHGLPGPQGDAHTDGGRLAMMATDWGRIVQAHPRAVVRPGSAREVADVLRHAREHEIPVAIRGAGHSPFGQSQVADGIVLDMTRMAHVRPGAGREVTAQAGAPWRHVLTAALARGLTPPVLTDYLDLSVGGTLAVGGLGGAGHRHGAQTDTVTALEVVTGDGTIVRCSAEHESALFDAVRAGLGQCGVITEATIRLLPARQRAKSWKLHYRDRAAFLADQRLLVTEDRFDHVEGRVLRAESGEWWHRLEATTYFSPPDTPDDEALCAGLSFDPEHTEAEETTYSEFLDRMADDVTALRADGSWFLPHPWVNVLIGDDEVDDVVGETLAGTRPADLGEAGLILLYPLRTDRMSTPLLRRPPTPLVWLFALLRTGEAFDPVGTARMIEANAALCERVRDGGGTVYPVNAVPMSPADWVRHFGDQWDTFAAARRRFDPAGLLSPGQNIFPAGR